MASARSSIGQVLPLSLITRKGDGTACPCHAPKMRELVRSAAEGAAKSYLPRVPHGLFL